MRSVTAGLFAATLIGAPIATASQAEIAAHAVLERLIGSAAAAQVSMTLTPSILDRNSNPVEEFTISGVPGNIAVQATTQSALTQGAGWYLKYVAHADLVLQGRNPTLSAQLPAPANPIRKIASVPNRYAFNDTSDAYTDPNLPWTDWENQLDLLALHGINRVYITVGTDYVYYQLMQRYGYTAAELRQWIPDPAHQPWWVLQNMSGSDAPIPESLLVKRAALGRRIADRARELGMTPVVPGYWGTVPTDFATRNPGADVIPQDTWVGYQRPSWLNPTTAQFKQVAADYYAISAQALGASTMYKIDPLHEGGVLGHVDLTQAATAIEGALRTAHPGATWVIIAWMNNPLPALLQGITDKRHLLLLATEADSRATWDSGQRWTGVPYAFGSIYNGGGRSIMGANAGTIVDRWFSDLTGPNAAFLQGIAIFPEAWTANPAAAELMSELPWQSSRFAVKDWLNDYAVGRYGTTDPHALNAWSILADTVYATPPDDNSEGQDSLFNAQPSLTLTGVTCCVYGRMRYSGPDFEKAWRELVAAAPAVTQRASYQFDLTDATRQVIVNRARVLLPLIRRAYDTNSPAQFTTLTSRWMQLLELADRVEGTHKAFMLGPHLDNAKANGSDAAEQTQFVRNAVNLITNWGTRAGYDSGLRDYAHRDWNCLTSTYYKERWRLFFNSLTKQLAGATGDAIDWYKFGDDFTNADHSGCPSAPVGDIVQIAQEVVTALDAGPETSKVPDGWASYAENEAVFGYDATGYTITSAGADLWQNINRYGVLYQRGALYDGGAAAVHIAYWQSEGNRQWARAGIMVGSNIVSTHPKGFANIALTPGHGCVFSWATDSNAGLLNYSESSAVAAPTWLRLRRIRNTYVGECSADGVAWTIVGNAIPGDIGSSADVGLFVSAANAGASDRFLAKFDNWTLRTGAGSGGKQVAIEYFHTGFSHYFITSIPDEIAKLDAGVFSGWVRTGQGFNVYSAAAAGLVPVCRFFTTAFPPTSSHFYAPVGLGCEGALANQDWQFEGEVFYSALPDANGVCPLGEVPIFRLYNNGQGGAPNHRFTISPSIRAQLLASGYIAEGSGIGVGMCSPL